MWLVKKESFLRRVKNNWLMFRVMSGFFYEKKFLGNLEIVVV